MFGRPSDVRHFVTTMIYVLLLADFFERFRDMCLGTYGIDAAHYYSAPGMAWGAALKMTKVNIELFINIHSSNDRYQEVLVRSRNVTQKPTILDVMIIIQ